MDWAAGFEKKNFRVLGVLGRLADLRGGFFVFSKNILQIICTVKKGYLPLT